MFIRRDSVPTGSLFDPEAFAYFEDTDLCWRVQISGWQVRYEAGIPAVLHAGGHTATRLETSIYEYHSFKNRLRSILVNTDKAALVGVLPRHIGVCICAATAALAAGRLPAVTTIARAYYWNLAHSKGTWQRRRSIQTANSRSFQEIFEKVGFKMKFGDYLTAGRAYERGKRQAQRFSRRRHDAEREDRVSPARNGCRRWPRR